MSRLAAMFLLVLAAAGCGQKGALYFAPPESQPATETGEVERDRPEEPDRPDGVAPVEPAELP